MLELLYRVVFFKCRLFNDQLLLRERSTGIAEVRVRRYESVLIGTYSFGQIDN